MDYISGNRPGRFGSYAGVMSGVRVGDLMKEWRGRRNRSQLDLAVDVGVSSRHLSFVETGRSRPSPELVLAVAHNLEVPLRERNAMLLAAGYAPRYGQTPLEADDMSRVRASIQRLLDTHDPYPGVAVDRHWNVILVNRAAAILTQGLPDHVLSPTLNVFRICLHPDGLSGRTINFDEWAGYLLNQLQRSIRATGDAGLIELEREILGYGNIGDIDLPAVVVEPEILIPIRLAAGEDAEISLFTTLTTFGTPQDVTLDELVIELFYPADGATEEMLRV